MITLDMGGIERYTIHKSAFRLVGRHFTEQCEGQANGRAVCATYQLSETQSRRTYIACLVPEISGKTAATYGLNPVYEFDDSFQGEECPVYCASLETTESYNEFNISIKPSTIPDNTAVPKAPLVDGPQDNVRSLDLLPFVVIFDLENSLFTSSTSLTPNSGNTEAWQ